jgi:hypothetical protein
MTAPFTHTHKTVLNEYINLKINTSDALKYDTTSIYTFMKFLYYPLREILVFLFYLNGLGCITIRNQF